MLNEPPHDKTNNVACALTEDSDPPSLIRVFAGRTLILLVLSCLGSHVTLVILLFIYVLIIVRLFPDNLLTKSTVVHSSSWRL